MYLCGPSFEAIIFGEKKLKLIVGFYMSRLGSTLKLNKCKKLYSGTFEISN